MARRGRATLWKSPLRHAAGWGHPCPAGFKSHSGPQASPEPPRVLAATWPCLAVRTAPGKQCPGAYVHPTDLVHPQRVPCDIVSVALTSVSRYPAGRRAEGHAVGHGPRERAPGCPGSSVSPSTSPGPAAQAPCRPPCSPPVTSQCSSLCDPQLLAATCPPRTSAPTGRGEGADCGRVRAGSSRAPPTTRSR